MRPDALLLAIAFAFLLGTIAYVRICCPRVGEGMVLR